MKLGGLVAREYFSVDLGKAYMAGTENSVGAGMGEQGAAEHMADSGGADCGCADFCGGRSETDSFEQDSVPDGVQLVVVESAQNPLERHRSKSLPGVGWPLSERGWAVV